MNELQVFNFQENQVRTQNRNNEIWFCLKDVCSILEIKNSRDVISRLNPNGVGSTDIGVQTGFKKDGTPAIQKVKMTFINESNLYKVIFQSRKPQAEQFTEWVTSEVLPKLRRNGYYSIAESRPIEDSNERLARIISKCTMVEQVELIRDLYSIPTKSPQPLKSRKMCSDSEMNKYIMSAKMSEGDDMKEVYQQYVEHCQALDMTPRTRQAFVYRVKDLRKLTTITECIHGKSHRILIAFR